MDYEPPRKASLDGMLLQAGANAAIAAIGETQWERGFAKLAISVAQVCVPLVVEAPTHHPSWTKQGLKRLSGFTRC